MLVFEIKFERGFAWLGFVEKKKKWFERRFVEKKKKKMELGWGLGRVLLNMAL